MPETTEPASPEERGVPAGFLHLPEPVRLEDTIAAHEFHPPSAVHADLDGERDFMLRYSG